MVPEKVSPTIPALLKAAAPGFQLPATLMLSDSWLAVRRLVWPVRGSSNEVVTHRPLPVSMCRTSWKKGKRHFETNLRWLLSPAAGPHVVSLKSSMKGDAAFGLIKMFCLCCCYCFNEQSGEAKKQTNQPLTANSCKQSHSETIWQPQNT